MRPHLRFVLAVLAIASTIFAYHTAQLSRLAPFRQTPTGEVFGVAFDFSLDYATASVHSGNEYINIARINGDSEYKKIMRDLVPASGPSDYPPYRMLDGSEGKRSVWSLPSLKLPPFLGAHRSSKSATHRMAIALRAATENYLNTPTHVVDYALPFYPSRASFGAWEKLLDQPSLGTYMTISSPRVAPLGALGASCDPPYCSNWNENDYHRLILTVSYSETALTIFLFDDEIGIDDVVYRSHDVLLGASYRDQDPHYYDLRVREAIERVVREASDYGAKNGEGKALRQIEGLVILSELGNDERLLAVLKDVLRKQYSRVDYESSDLILYTLRSHMRLLDPIYAASNGVAMNSLAVQNSLGWEGPENRLSGKR